MDCVAGAIAIARAVTIARTDGLTNTDQVAGADFYSVTRAGNKTGGRGYGRRGGLFINQREKYLIILGAA
jgi:hypothetical protein